MKIKKITLENVRCFKNFDLNLTTDKSEETLSHCVLVGRNGTGKSTILQFVVKLFTWLISWYEKVPDDIVDNLFVDEDIYFGEKYLRIAVFLEFNHEEQEIIGQSELAIGYQHFAKEIGESDSFFTPQCFHSNEEFESYQLCLNKFTKVILMGRLLYFDAFRFLSRENPIGPNLQEKVPTGYSLLQANFDNYGRNTERDFELKQWIINVDYMRLKNISGRYEILYHHLVKAFDLLLHPLKFENINEEGKIIFKDEKNDQFIPIDMLSDGFKSVFQIILGTMRMLFDGFPGVDLFYRNAGIVLVDEIDCHIHPRWQKSLMPSLSELFPNCQFIVTSHSPYIIESVQYYEIKRVGDKSIE